MAELKLVIGDPKTKKSHQKVLSADASKALMGMKVGDKFKGEAIDMTGYEFEITGGSDNCGFPMRKDLIGTLRKKILAVSGIGLKEGRRGMRQRKTVAGNTIFEKTAQVNVKVLKEGKAPLEAPKTEEKKE